MATKPSWLNVSPSSGSGNGTISNSSNEHTGRVIRTGTVTVTASGVAVPKTYTVNQTPKAEFCSFDNGAEMAASKNGGNVTIEGKSNSSKLTFSIVESNTDIAIPDTYTASGMETNNGTEITGDPGASSQYAFSLAINIPANATIEEVTRTILVTANGGQTSQIAIKQAAGDATLEIEPTEITIPQDGSAVSVTVKSNTSWEVS